MKINFEPEFLIVDSFCGAGGVTEGFEQAEINGKRIAIVIVGINHDKEAIESHATNHPETMHFVEDVRTLDLKPVIAHVKKMRRKYPNAKLIFHASLECTNFSKAKGGLPRDADSRTLAEYMDRYVEALNPHYITIENVVEFMSWGKLDANGKPISMDKGNSWMRWRKKINKYGYTDKWTELNAANYGAFTSRNRLFGMFAKNGLPIVFPDPTHAKNPSKGGLFSDLKKWKPVREVLDLEDKGKSIFEREKPLSEKTLQRIYAGLIKFVAGGKESFLSKNYAVASNHHGCTDTDNPFTSISTRTNANVVQPEFIMKYFSGRPEGKVIGIDRPAGTIKTIDGQALVSPEFISTYHGNGHNCTPLSRPCPTIPTRDSAALIQPEFFLNYHHSSNADSLDKPSPTLTTKDKLYLCQPQFIFRQFRTARLNSIDDPSGSITTTPKMNLVSSEFISNNFLLNPSWTGSASSIEKPSPVIIARQDKAPMYLVATENGEIGIVIYENDSEYTKKIKEFMSIYGIVSIKMRMLKVKELLKIQGFPENYVLKGNQQQQKKFIGNSVVPLVIKKWAESLATYLIDQRKKIAA